MPVKRKVSKKAAPVVAAAATSSPTSFIISSGSDNEAEATDALPKKRVSSRKQALAPAPAAAKGKNKKGDGEADGGSDVIVGGGRKKSQAVARGKSRRKGPEPEDAGEEEEEEVGGVGDAPPPPPSPPQRTRKKPAPAAPVAENKVPVQGAKKRRRKATPALANDEAIEVEDEINPKVVGKAKRKRGEDGGDGDEGEDEDGDELSAPNGRKRVNGVPASARFKLEELRTNSAENALEEFKKNSDALAKEAEKVIAALRADLEKQTALAGESKSLKEKLKANDATIAKLRSKISELGKDVAKEKKENQVLQAKLIAAQQKIQVPGSAVKASAMGRGILPAAKSAGVSPSGDQAWISHMKEELYGDLTNLMILSVKMDEGRRLFQCVQTGNSGSLHFKLSVRDPAITNQKKPKAPAAPNDSAEESDEQGDFLFTPLLNAERDKSVIAVLPVYLKSEISFEKEYAMRFYKNLSESLMRTPEEGEEEDEEDDEEYTDVSQSEGKDEEGEDEGQDQDDETADLTGSTEHKQS